MPPSVSAPGEVIRVTRVFPVDRPGKIWSIDSGKLDIFLAPVESGEPAGALTHVLRVEAGEFVFALPSSRENNFGFLASPAAETVARVLDAADFSAAELQEISAHWVRGLFHALGEEAPSREQPLADFMEAAAARLISLRLRADEEEARRLSARSRADERVVSLALRTLSRPFGDRAADARSSVPLVAACEAVARAAGITLRIPPAVIQGKARDPLHAIARHSAVRTRKLVLRDDWWKQDSGPMLAFLEEENRPVALLPRSRIGYDLFDPQADTTVRVKRDTARALTGIAYIYYRPFPNRALTGAQVLLLGLTGCSRDLWVIGIMSLLASLLSLVAPYAMGVVFDTIIPGSERDQLLQTVALIVASAVATALISVTRGYALLRVEGKLDFNTQAALWDRLLNLPVTFFRNYSAGDLANRSLAVSQIREVISGTTVLSILSGVFSVTSLFLLFYYSPPLAALAALLAFIALAVMVTGGLLQFKLQRQVAENAGRIAGMVFEFVDGIAKFKVSGTEGRAFARWAGAFVAQKKLAAAARKIGNMTAVFDAGFRVIALCVIFWAVAGQLHARGGGLSTGAFLAFNAAFVQLLAAAMALGTGILSVLRTIPLYTRARPIFEALPETDADKADPGDLSGAIEVNHLAFRYSPETPLVLRDVSFSIRAGEFVAFVGASGSGKSTLLRLLLGFEKPLSGAIYFDGQDIGGLDIQEVRAQMGVVLQNGKLLPGDILTNIIGSRPLTVDHAWEAARMAGIEQDIKDLPMGMYTVVAEGGRGLSGGQRQRLMIARAIVGKPRIMLFDEATSALDNRAQEIVSHAMEQMSAGQTKVTRIVIAHRLSTIVKADRIVVLDKGLIVQTGTYEELIDQPGFFADLAKRQLA
jgi:NHLM bacteriocin system ABC transporter ATP-binding protein